MSDGRRVLVTGASRGIGRAIALRLAADGFDLTLHCVSRADLLQDVVDQAAALGVDVQQLQFDVRDREQAALGIAADIEAHGAYYGVVCNAGIARDNAFPSIGGDDWDAVIDTNLGAFYNVLNPVIMPMVRRRQPGRIVTLSSVSGVIGNRGQVNYSASKAGIIGATKALAVEMAKRRITVNCVAPGMIQTDMIDGAHLDEAMKMIPARRVGTPEEVAATVAFLMSDGAAYITREVINVNGGMF